MSWDGEDQRQQNPDMMKLLNSMDKNLALLTQSSQAQADAFKIHVAEDKANFETQAKKIDFSTKCIYFALGAIGLIEFLGKLNLKWGG